MNHLSFAPVEYPHVTPRELEVIKLLSEGKPFKIIAREMGISYGTAKQHSDHVRRKFGLHSSLQVALFALRNGLV